MNRQFTAAIAFVISCLSIATSGRGAPLQTFDFQVSSFALHPHANLLYATLPAQNAVAIINTSNLSLVNTVFVGSNPRGFAVTPDGSKLYVANSGSTFLGVMDTATNLALPSIALPTTPSDVEVGLNGRVYVTPASQSIGIMQVNGQTGTYVDDFDLGVFVYSAGLLEISPDRTSLYFANRGLSPGTLAEYSVASDAPSLIYKNPHGSLGSNGQDLALSHDGEMISYAVGGGNAGYVIFAMDPDNYSVLGSFNTGAYPREIVFSPDDTRAYTVHTSGRIDVFSTSSFLQLPPILTQGEASELIVDHSGRYLFAAVDNQLRVYATGVPEPGVLVLLAAGVPVLMRRRRHLRTVRGAVGTPQSGSP